MCSGGDGDDGGGGPDESNAFGTDVGFDDQEGLGFDDSIGGLGDIGDAISAAEVAGLDQDAFGSPDFAAPSQGGFSAPASVSASQQASAEQDAIDAAIAIGGISAATSPNQGLFDRELFSPIPGLPQVLQPPNTLGRMSLGILGMVNPAFTGLSVFGKGMNALGAVPGTDVDAFGAQIGDVGTTDTGGGSQGSGGQSNLSPEQFAELFGVPDSPISVLAPPNLGPSFAPFPGALPVREGSGLTSFPQIPADQLAAFQRRLNRFGV